MKLARIDHSRTVTALLLSLLLVVSTRGVSAQQANPEAPRPSAMKLFPHETIFFARLAHGRELFERFDQTGMGKMLRDPQVQPLLSEFWQLAGTEFDEEASEDIGLSWGDWSRIPKGELAWGVVAREGAELGLLWLADFDGELADAEYMLEQLRAKWEKEGRTFTEETIGTDTITIVRRGENRATSFGYLLKEGCFVGSTDETLLRHLLDRWVGRTPEVVPAEESEETETEDATAAELPVAELPAVGPLPGERTLAENEAFVAILQECSTQLEEPPQVLFFVDPLGVVKNTFGKSMAGRIAVATFPALGIDGIQDFGGTLSLATKKWDSVTHLHLLLDNPRSGVLTLLRFEEGDTTPPSYVPADAMSYSTLHADVPGIMSRLTTLLDKFRYEGALDEMIEKGLSEPLGTDFREALFDNLEGRLTLLTRFDDLPQENDDDNEEEDSDEERPRLMRQRGLAVTLIDPSKTANALEEVAKELSDELERHELGGMTYYKSPWDSSCLCVYEDSLIFCTSVSTLHALIEAGQGARARLADSVEMKVIQSRAERLTRGRPLSMLFYQNSAVAIGHFYLGAQLPSIRGELKEDDSAFSSGLYDLLDPEQLPPVETLKQYITPTGGYLLDTPTGLHFMAFGLRYVEPSL